MKEFNELYVTYSKKVYKYFLYLTGDTHLSEDLLQETFYQAFKSINTFKSNSTIGTWLFGIAKNVYLKEMYKKSKNKNLYMDELNYELMSSVNIEEEFENKEKLKKVIEEVYNLEENYRQVFILRIGGELSFKEIGDLLSKNENWARITFYRAKIKIKEALEVK